MLLPVYHDEKTIVLNCKYKTLKNQIKRFHFFLCFSKIHGLLQSKDAQNVRLLYALHPHVQHFPKCVPCKAFVHLPRSRRNDCLRQWRSFFLKTQSLPNLCHTRSIKFASPDRYISHKAFVQNLSLSFAHR